MGCQSQIDAADSIPKEIRFQSLLPHIIAYAAAPIDQEIFPAAAQMDTVSLSHIHKDHIIMRDRAVSEPLQQNSHQQDQQDAAKNRPVLLTQAQKQAGLRGGEKRAPQEKYRQPQRWPRHIYCRRAAKRESVIDEEQQPRHRVQKRRNLRVEFSTDAKKQEAEHRERHEISGQINHRDIRDQTDK